MDAGASRAGALRTVEEDRVVGVAELLTDGEVIGYLGLLVVSANARRHGAARTLLSELFDRSGLTRLDFLSEDDSVAFYESFPHKVKPGFRLYGES